MKLEAKTALITGGARRLGRCMGLALARAGAHVVVHYHRSREDAEATVEAIRAAGVNAWLLAADLADPVAAAGCVGRASELAGPIDILVNNASVFEPSRLLSLTGDDLLGNVRLHALAPLELARAFAAQQREGAILNLLDARIAGTDPEHAAYHLSKQMLYALTRSLALELAPSVRVNGIAPGLVLAPEGEDTAYLEARAHSLPLRRHGTPDDVADAALYLLRSDFVTGQVIFVDGGYHVRGPNHV